MQRIDAGVIARRYYDPDTTPHAATPETLARYLRTMLDDLVQLALRHGSAALASHLKASIKQHGSAKLTAVTLRMVEQASTLAAAAPSLDHPVGLWFRPLVLRCANSASRCINCASKCINSANTGGVGVSREPPDGTGLPTSIVVPCCLHAALATQVPSQECRRVHRSIWQLGQAIPASSEVR